MRNKFFQQISGIVLLSSILIGFVPTKAEAFFPGIPTPTIKIADVYQVAKDVGLGALRGVALQASNKFLTRFTNKLQNKYKIRNYLYYDRLLSDYYLQRFIADKIRLTDPDLYKIYDLMYRGYVSGQPTGTNNAPDPRKALIPQLKQAMADYYVNNGGIDPAKIRNPGSFTNDREYFASAQAYFANPPSFTEQNIQGQFGAFQSSATTAAQLEISVGNSLKAGRLIGGTCKQDQSVVVGDTLPDEDGETEGTVSAPVLPIQNAKDPVACAAAGGIWQESALDMARSFIDNPTGLVDKYLGSAIITKIDKNFDPNNFWSQVGAAVGSFLFNQLTLDKPDGILEEYPNTYDPESATPDPNTFIPDTDLYDVGTEIDIDGDDITDGQDIDGDGQPDICVYGGSQEGSVGPPCKTSTDALTTPPPPEACADPKNSVPNYRSDLRSAFNEVNDENPDGIADALNEEVDGKKVNGMKYLNEVAEVLRDRGFNATTNVKNGNGNSNKGDLIAIWRSGDPLVERWDSIQGQTNPTAMRDATQSIFTGDIPLSCTF